MAQLLPYPLKSVDIVGLGASVYSLIAATHDKFPKYDPGQHQVWTINAGCKLLYHDVCFDIHTDEYLNEQKKREDALQGEEKVVNTDRAFLRRQWQREHPGSPIVMAKADPTVPNSFTYPLKHVVEKTGIAYFDCGLAYIMAFALCCGVERMGLFGCDFNYTIPGQTAKEDGKACAEFWCGFAKGMGVTLEVPQLSTLLNMMARVEGRLYGYHENITYENTEAGCKLLGPDYDNAKSDAVHASSERAVVNDSNDNRKSKRGARGSVQ